MYDCKACRIFIQTPADFYTERFIWDYFLILIIYGNAKKANDIPLKNS